MIIKYLPITKNEYIPIIGQRCLIVGYKYITDSDVINEEIKN